MNIVVTVHLNEYLIKSWHLYSEVFMCVLRLSPSPSSSYGICISTIHTYYNMGKTDSQIIPSQTIGTDCKPGLLVGGSTLLPAMPYGCVSRDHVNRTAPKRNLKTWVGCFSYRVHPPLPPPSLHWQRVTATILSPSPYNPIFRKCEHTIPAQTSQKIPSVLLWIYAHIHVLYILRPVCIFGWVCFCVCMCGCVCVYDFRHHI